jgi:hypothetical protein
MPMRFKQTCGGTRRFAGSECYAVIGCALHASLGGPSPITQTMALIKSGLTPTQCVRPCVANRYVLVNVQVGDDTQFLRLIWIHGSGDRQPRHTRIATPNIGLAAVQTQLRDPNRLDVLLQWAVSGAIDANYGISLRLHDAAGKVWTSLDTQPGYGFQPTSAWQPGAQRCIYARPAPRRSPRDQALCARRDSVSHCFQAGSRPHDH